VAVAGAVGLSLGGCSQADDAAPADDPGLSHVHGLGVDPADATLYAATHYGLFRVPDRGEPERVANRFQDTMGFVVAGPNRFLGSGHPDFQEEALHRDGRPPLLGLVESRDAGETWKPLSLLGEADFHAIAVSGQTIAAYDATGDRLMVSTDGRQWSERIGGIGMSGLAADPEDPARLLAVTPAGLELSRDEGVTFAPLPSAPRAVLVSWFEATLWAVDADGQVATAPAASLEAGAWAPVGKLPGEPQAFVATAQGLFAAVTVDGESRIYRSSDGGSTWRVRFRDPGPSS
jgi:hypothetical protein